MYVWGSLDIWKRNYDGTENIRLFVVSLSVKYTYIYPHTD